MQAEEQVRKAPAKFKNISFKIKVGYKLRLEFRRMFCGVQQKRISRVVPSLDGINRLKTEQTFFLSSP